MLVVVLVRASEEAGSKGQISLRRKGSGSSLRKISLRNLTLAHSFPKFLTTPSVSLAKSQRGSP